MTKLTNSEILALKLDNKITIREYLYSLLYELWKEGECFSGKRPFGNSGWEYDLYKPLVEAKLVKGKLDEFGFIEEVDEKKANKIVFDLIRAMCLEKA